MNDAEAQRIEEQLSFEPDVSDDGDHDPGFWLCEHCQTQNSRLDGECQFCDANAGLLP